MGKLQSKILVLQVREAGRQGLGRGTLQRVVAKPVARAAAGYDPFFDAYHLALIQRGGPLAIDAARLNIFIEQHGDFLDSCVGCVAATFHTH